MKKLLIVNNNMKVGGVQKSLRNLLWELNKRADYDVTLVLFNPSGDYMDELPPRIKYVSVQSLFRYIGTSQREMKGIDIIKRGFLAATCRILGRAVAVKFMLLSQKKLTDEYDCAIAFLHNGRQKSFFGGVQDFVLYRTKAKKKIAFLHDDYEKCGANHRANNKMMAKFDVIAACSDGCRGVFEALQPHLASKSETVRNCNNVEEIWRMAEQDTIKYDSTCLNVVCAARFSPRKGVDRAIEAVASVLGKGVSIKLYILGTGIMESSLKQMVIDRQLGEHVIFCGEQGNPYRYMKNADLFLLSSFHEAAPMVIDEAYILGVPVLTTRTNSSDEMVTYRNCGWVCENNQDALNEMLYKIVSDKDALLACKHNILQNVPNNSRAMEQFDALINGQ